MADQNDGAGVVPEPLGSELVDQDGELVNVVRMHTGSTSGPIIQPGKSDLLGLLAESMKRPPKVDEGLGLPAPERVWVDEADRLWDRTHGSQRPGAAELERREHNAGIEDAAELADREQETELRAVGVDGPIVVFGGGNDSKTGAWTDEPVEQGYRAQDARVAEQARTYREILEAEGPGGPGGVGFRANAGNRAGKSSARVYGFGDFTFEYNSLTGDVTVTSRTDFLLVEPTRPGQARLTSKRRQGQPGVGIG